MCAIFALFIAKAGAVSVTGASSWFGGTCDGYDNNRTASGISNTQPGIAMYRYDTLRKLVLLTDLRTKRRVVAYHLDIGPAPWTGKLIDVNPPAAAGLGFAVDGAGCVLAFPTGRVMRATVLSRRQASRWARRTSARVDDRFIWRVR